MDQVVDRFERRLHRANEIWPEFDAEFTNLKSQIGRNPTYRETSLRIQTLATNMERVSLFEKAACIHPSRHTFHKLDELQSDIESSRYTQNALPCERLLVRIQNVRTLVSAHFFYAAIIQCIETNSIQRGWINLLCGNIADLEKIKHSISPFSTIYEYTNKAIDTYLERGRMLAMSLQQNIAEMFENEEYEQLEDLYITYQGTVEGAIMLDVAQGFGVTFRPDLVAIETPNISPHPWMNADPYTP